MKKENSSGYSDPRDDVDFKISKPVVTKIIKNKLLFESFNISTLGGLLVIILSFLVIIIQFQKIASLENRLQKFENLLCNTKQINSDVQNLLKCN